MLIARSFWDRSSSRHFRVTSRRRSLAAWIPDWLVMPTSPVGSQRTGGHVAADVGITTTSALILRKLHAANRAEATSKYLHRTLHRNGAERGGARHYD